MNARTVSYPIHTVVKNHIVSTARFREISHEHYSSEDPKYIYETMIFAAIDGGHLGAHVENYQERTNDESAVPAQHQAGIDFVEKL